VVVVADGRGRSQPGGPKGRLSKLNEHFPHCRS
jgi:hypothetical protein